MSIDTHRTAMASSEIMQKLQAITGQLNADFTGLRKDGEIFVVWVAEPNSYERFDRIMFFTGGGFQSYGTDPMVHGNLARISYMLAKKDGEAAQYQEPQERILARTQHILTDDTDLEDSLDINTFDNQKWSEWHNLFEYDKIFLDAWKNISAEDKQDMLTIITDVSVGLLGTPRVGDDWRGAMVNPADANSIHMLLCEGVGEFKVQGWYAAEQRWVPEVDPDGDGDLTDDSDFFISGSELDPEEVPGVLYPYPPNGRVSLGGVFLPGNPFQELLNEAKFDYIPGLGRALKFTFTLYDSKGILKEGKTYTHIVYLGD